MSGETLVSVSDLHRRYGDLHAVRGVSFELRPGEVLGLLGPNGAGKTSTMNMVCGALAPSAGSVSIDGADLIEQPMAAKRRIGYLPEQPPLHPELTVDEYLDFSARLRGVARRDVRAAREEAKARTGLEGTGGRLVGNLSKGFRQRAGIAQAIVHQPSVVVLDEPTVGLDPNQIREIRDLIRDIGRDRGVILSTHILPEVQAVCTRVQIMHEGMLVLNEPMEALRDAAPALRVRLARDPGVEALARLPAVRDVQTLGDGGYRLGLATADGAAERIAAEIVAAGWGLRELTPEVRSLEEIFVSLTTSERTPEPEADAGC